MSDGAALAQRIDALASHEEIAAVLALHSRGIDRCEPGWIRAAYHADAAVAYGMFNGLAHEFAAVVTDGIRDLPVTAHRSNQSWIALAGDRAKSETYIIAYMDIPGVDGATQSLIGGRYLDRLERRGGAWRLMHRTYVLDWNLNRLKADAAPTPIPLGAHGATDPGARILGNPPAGGEAMSDSQDTARLDRALSRQALLTLNAIYARAVDRVDRALFDSLWHPDATVETGFYDGPAKGYGDLVFGMIASRTRTFHGLSNHWFEISADQAVGEIYVFAVDTGNTASGPEDTLTGGRYVDRYERRDGAWKIAHRLLVLDWTIRQPSTAIFGDGLYAPLKLRGERAPNDPVYAFWADCS